MLYDEFDAHPVEGLAFTGPFAETLFWGVAAQVTSAGFGAGLVGGVSGGRVAGGAGFAQLPGGELRERGADGPQPWRRGPDGRGRRAGGGCTVGAGLAGVPTLGLAAVVAIASIVAGIYGADAVLSPPRCGAEWWGRVSRQARVTPALVIPSCAAASEPPRVDGAAEVLAHRSPSKPSLAASTAE